MKKINKNVLKEKNGYYYEFRPFYDSLPSKLTVPEYRTAIFPKKMTHREIMETYRIMPYSSVEDAFAVIADCIPTLKNDYKGRIAYFNDKDGTPCRLDVWRGDDGRLGLGVDEVGPGGEWSAGGGVLSSNNETGNLGTVDPLSSETLTLTDEQCIEQLKSNGYRITKMIEKEY